MNNTKIILVAFWLSGMLFTACSDHTKEAGVTKPGKPADAAIGMNTVLQPVNSTVISTVNAIVPKQKAVQTTIPAEGYLDFDTRTFNNIAARFSGRIEKLYIKYAFQEIHKGQRIFDIYSPDMVTAQQDLVYLNRNSARETSLVNAARQKLLLLGMSAEQIDQVVKTGKPFNSLPVYSPYDGHVHDVAHSQMPGNIAVRPEQNFTGNLPLLIKEGMYIEKGQSVFNVVDPHHLWAILKIGRSAVAGLKPNQPVKISSPDMPGKTIDGKVDFIEPFLQSGDKSTSIRVYIDNMDHTLKVNSLVKATIKTGEINALWIPREALLDLGETKIVWVKSGRLFKVRQVTTGMINGNEIQITKGLASTDSLAENAQYLTDSESFIKTQENEK